MNIKIIEFAGRQVLSGKVIAVSQPVTDNIAATDIFATFYSHFYRSSNIIRHRLRYRDHLP